MKGFNCLQCNELVCIIQSQQPTNRKKTMKAIKITEANKTVIEAALKAANGAATAHTTTTFKEVEFVATMMEQQVYRLVGTKDMMVGAKVTHQSGDSLPNAYKYDRQVTVITMERRATGWFLTSATSATAYKEAGRETIYLTEQQDEAAIAQLRKAYKVTKSATN